MSVDPLVTVVRDIFEKGEWVDVDLDEIDPQTILLGSQIQERLRAALTAHDEQNEIKVLEDELVYLWSDFEQARAFNFVGRPDPADEHGGWSIQMLNLADRITDITRLVGSPTWESIPVMLLLGGWWDSVHRRANLEPPAFDRQRAQAVLDRRMEDR